MLEKGRFRTRASPFPAPRRQPAKHTIIKLILVILPRSTLMAKVVDVKFIWRHRYPGTGFEFYKEDSISTHYFSLEACGCALCFCESSACLLFIIYLFLRC